MISTIQERLTHTPSPSLFSTQTTTTSPTTFAVVVFDALDDTSASMDASSASMQSTQLNSSQPPSSANHQSQSSSSTGPQIRSRITVVCAECKRLKLKCDRRSPCGSCTKRDTVVRCIYSPAAAEKVDLHSLNNRLIQVEATLALITAGQTPPVFQSTYPFSNPPSNPMPSTSPHYQGPHHQHHHHYSAPSSRAPGADSISISRQDLSSIWLDELELGVQWPTSRYPSTSPLVPSREGTSGFIKLESSHLEFELDQQRNSSDDAHLPFPHSHNGSTMNGSGTGRPILPSRPSSPFKRISPRAQQQRFLKEQRSSAQLLLPALSIYFPVPSIQAPGTSSSSSAAFPHRPSSSPSSPPSGSTGYNFSSGPQYTKPQITPSLLALLPPPTTCARFLQSAKEVFRVRPLPFEPGSGNGWMAFEKRCLLLLGVGSGKKDRERREREREKAREAKQRARQIYFGGLSRLQTQDADLDDGGSGGSNGDRGSSENGEGAGMEGEQSLTFFAKMCAVFAVGASVSSPATSGMASTESPAFFYALAQQALGVWDTHISSSGSAGIEERERMDYLFACLVGVIYLLHSGSAVGEGGDQSEKDSDSGLIYTLVGKMVTAARGMGLGREGSKTHSGANEKRGSFSSGLSSTGRQENDSGQDSTKEEWRKMVWWEVLFYDLFTADTLGHQPYISAYSYTTNLPACAELSSSSSDVDEVDSGDEDADHAHGFGMQNGHDRRHSQQTVGPATERDDAYLGARYRLTQLAQTIKSRISHPDCCCGYTLDQAASLEGEIKRWQSALPHSLKGPSEDAGHTSPFQWDDNVEVDRAAQAQSYELATMANFLVLKVYTPFLRHPTSEGGPSSMSHGTSASGSAISMNSPASQSSIHAAQAIIRVAKALQSSLSTTTTNILPAMFDFYPLDKVVFDSVVICAHAAFTGKASTLLLDGGALADDVGSGLNVLSGLPSSASGSVADTQKKITEALFKRLISRGMNVNTGSGTKRKHDQVDMGAYASTSDYGSSSNGAAGGSNGENIMAGFDFQNTGNSQGGSFLHHGLPVAQQQHTNLVDLSPPPAPAPPFTAAHQVPTRNQEKEKDSSEKDKKGHKKHAGYPPIGIRVRPGKDVRSLVGGSVPPPLMTSTPRPLPNADVVLAFQQQQKQKMEAQNSPPVGNQIGSAPQQTQTQTSSPAISALQHQDPYRSRSSSLSHVQSQQQQHQQMDYPIPFVHNTGGADNHPRKRFAMQDNRQQQHISPQAPPFTPHTLDQGQQHQMYDQHPQRPFDANNGSSGSALDSMGFTNVSNSPFNGTGQPSSTGSPFGTNSSSGPSSTPTFTTHHPTPPVFGPAPPPPQSQTASPPTNSPATFFSVGNYDGSYSNSPGSSSSLSGHNHGENVSLVNMGMDSAMMTLPSTPVYEKSHQSVMDQMLEQHTQHSMGSSYDAQELSNHNQHMSMGMTVGSSWSTVSPSQPTPFWDNGADFKFYQH